MFCPNCHMSTLRPHPESKYRDYKKCRSCGYMELEIETVKRVSCKLSADESCDCKFLCEKVTDMSVECKQIKKQNSSQDSSSNATKD